MSSDPDQPVRGWLTRFIQAWRSFLSEAGACGPRPRPANYLGDCQGNERLLLLMGLLVVDVIYRSGLDESLAAEDYADIPGASQVFEQVLGILGQESDESTLPSGHRQIVYERTERFTQAWLSFLSEAGTSRRPPCLENYLGDCQDEELVVLLRAIVEIDVFYRGRQREKPGPRSAAPDMGRIGPYKVVKLLGRGAFGDVYLAYDLRLRRRVAIKIARSDRSWTEREIEMFEREGQILANLEHSNLVSVYASDQHDDGRPYLVYEYIEGTTLKDLIERKKKDPSESKKRRDHRESIEWIAAVADALAYLHSEKIVHRDVKPANILIDARGKPYLVDFGLALRDEDFGKGPDVVGTLFYVSPELASGKAPLVDGTSDIFSLGVVLYELLTGHRPFTGETMSEVWKRICTAPVRPMQQLDPSIDSELQDIVDKALQKCPKDRYQAASYMADDLRCYGGKPPVREPLPPKSPLLIWLVDRQKQDHEIRLAFAEYHRAAVRCPIMFFVYGSVEQAIHEYVDRLKKNSLPRALTSIGSADNIVWCDPRWVRENDWETDPERTMRYLRQDIEDTIEEKLGRVAGSWPQNAPQILSNHRSHLVFCYRIRWTGWNDEHLQTLKVWIKEWGQFPMLPSAYAVIVFFVAEYEFKKKSWNPFVRRSDSSRQIARQFRALLDSDEYGVTRRLLSELGNITFHDVIDWIIHVLRPTDQAAVIRKAREICDDPDLLDDGVSMESIEPKLREILSNLTSE